MRLITPYAPGSFLKPCLVISTIYIDDCRETCLAFVEALHCDHAMTKVFSGKGSWVKIQDHAQVEDAVAYHLALVAPFKNGGTQAEWDEGWESYLALYKSWCPAELKAPVDA